jgi:hypothetical protein
MAQGESMAAEKLNEYAQRFADLAAKRHYDGEAKYGPGTFLKVDTLEMALEEVADLYNYALYTGIKLYALQEALQSDGTTAVPEGFKDVAERKIL